MKKIISALTLLSCATAIMSCNEKLNIAAPYKNITVVYGLLNKADTAHYVRIQKAFMDENQSALDMAKVADSSFYQSLDVVMREIGPSGSILNNLVLNRVELSAEGFSKDTGVFFNTPSYAFKFKHSLNAANTYRLVVTNTLTGAIDSAETPIIDNNQPIASFGVTEWQRSNESISFSRMLTVSGKPDVMNYGINVPANVGVAELIIRFNWTDSNITTGAATHKYADFNTFTALKAITPSTSSSQSFSVEAQNKDIYDFLRSSLGVPSDINDYRYIDSCDVYLYVAGIEYKRYNDLNQNKGGLTADEIKPLYTNIKGLDVMGLFSVRASTQKLQIPIAQATQDSIKLNSRTKDLNIRFYK